MNKIANLSLAPPDFTGITPDLIHPSIGGVVLPTAPTQPLINVPSVGNDPDIPVLTTALIATDALIADLIAQIKANLEARLSHATGLNPVVEAALFGRAVDRETGLMRTGYENYLSNNASVGFSAAPGQDQAAFIAFERDRKGKLSDINRDIMVKQAELEQSNIQKTLDSYQALESQLFGQKQSNEANELRLYDSKEEVMVKRVGLLNDINHITVENYAQDVEAYATTGRVTMEQAKLLLEQVNAVNGLNSSLAGIALEKLKVVNSYNIGKYQAVTEAEKAIGATLGQLSATLFNTMNYSQSWSHGISWSGSESLSA
jgi:hypothetical protein